MSAPGLNKLAEMSTTPFHLYVWPHRLLVIGPSHASGQHRHHAAQIACGLEGQVVYRSPQDGEQRGDLLLIPPDTLHSHEAFGAAAVLYLDAESLEWAHFASGNAAGLVSLPFSPRLRAFGRRAAGGDADAAQALVSAVIGSPGHARSGKDPLVSQVCELVCQRLDGQITLAGLASAVHRSPSRLSHRFREATGLPLRRYVLWCRLRAAAEAAMRGATLTEAAHVAGFADSAHLSRTFRATFGIAPSFLFEWGRFEVTFCDAAQVCPSSRA
jgi:AraC family transcriptional regulator